MGIGGDLMWTSLAYEIYKKHNKKVIFYRNEKINGKYQKTILKLHVFCNNPYISFNPEKDNIEIDLNFRIMPEMLDGLKNLWKDQHIIKSRCEYFNYYNTQIKCHLYPTKDENKIINNILKKLPKNFIIIEPNAKKDWRCHKQYPLDKWQNIVNKIVKKIPIVQMSIPTPDNKILDNVINISHDIKNFRQACFILKYSELFVSTEGGLMHGCNAVDSKSLIIYPPFYNINLTKYNNTEIISLKTESHKICNKFGRCKRCLRIINLHDENIIINKIINLLKLN